MKVFLTSRIEKELSMKLKKHLIDLNMSYAKWLEKKILEELRGTNEK